MSRQSIVAPIGMVTQPSKYGQYKRGALSVATNVVMRSPGIISSMPGVRTLRASVATGTDRIIRTMLSADTHTLQYLEDSGALVSALSWVNASGVQTVTLPTNWVGVATAGCARFAKARDRFFFTCWSPTIGATKFRSALAWDTENAATARAAGLSPVALISLDTGITTDAQSIDPVQSAAWRALVRRVGTIDKYDLVSAPSWAITGFSGAVVIDAVIKVHFPSDHNYVAGDYVEVYRTRQVAGADTDPGDTMLLSVSQVITAANITAGFALVRDNCKDAALGAALYTNVGVEGNEAANYDPPASADMCAFKGHMFYAATMTPSQATIAPRASYGLLATNYERLYGIGQRTSTGTFAIGSPTVTAVNNMRGIVPGMYILSGNLPGGDAFVISVTATTFTLDENATGAGVAASFFAQDSVRYAQPSVFGGESYSMFQWFIGSNVGIASSPFVWISNVNVRCDIATGSATNGIQYGVEMIARSPRVYGSSMTVRATNGVNYSPPLPDATATANSYAPETRQNRYAWSKVQLPEAVPPLNYGFVGSGKLLRLITTRDALWLFCTDGLYRLSGDGGNGPDAWRLDLADPNLILAARTAVCTLKETIWCYTSRGLVAVSDDGGIQEISLGIIGDQIPGATFSDTWDTWMVSDDAHQEVWLTFRSGTLGAGSSVTYIFNALTKTFVKFSDGNEYSTAVYAPFLTSLVWGKVIVGSPAGNPSQMYSELDSSTVRIPGPDVRYQPLYAQDPFVLKQFQDVTMVFDGLNAAATLTPLFSDVAYTSFAVNQSATESRCTIGVPRNAPAIAGILAPGFQMSNVAAPWSFRGLSARFTPGGETTERD